MIDGRAQSPAQKPIFTNLGHQIGGFLTVIIHFRLGFPMKQTNHFYWLNSCFQNSSQPWDWGKVWPCRASWPDLSGGPKCPVLCSVSRDRGGTFPHDIHVESPVTLPISRWGNLRFVKWRETPSHPPLKNMGIFLRKKPSSERLGDPHDELETPKMNVGKMDAVFVFCNQLMSPTHCEALIFNQTFAQFQPFLRTYEST